MRPHVSGKGGGGGGSQPYRDVAALSDPHAACYFNMNMLSALEGFEDTAAGDGDVDLGLSRIVDGFHHAAERTLPLAPRRTTRPWTSAGTLGLIERRGSDRRQGDTDEEKRLSKKIRASVARDNAAWI